MIGAPYCPTVDSEDIGQTKAETSGSAGNERWRPAVTPDGINLLANAKSFAYDGETTKVDVTLTRATPWCTQCGAVDSARHRVQCHEAQPPQHGRVVALSHLEADSVRRNMEEIRETSPESLYPVGVVHEDFIVEHKGEMWCLPCRKHGAYAGSRCVYAPLRVPSSINEETYIHDPHHLRESINVKWDSCRLRGIPLSV